MYVEWWGLNERPFENVPDPRFLYLSKDHQEAFFRMRYLAESRKGAGMLIGDVGCGKTTLARALIQKLSGEKFELGLVTYPALEPDDFLKEILYQFGMSTPNGSKVDLLHALNDLMLKNYRAEKDSVLIIDEAHVISDVRTLEEIRLLLNFQLDDRFLLSLILIGQPELRAIIKSVPALEQRIAIRFNLGPLSETETINYIVFRLKVAGATKPIFTKQAMGVIHRLSDGVPRNINNIADMSLLVGFGQKLESIDGATVEKLVKAEMR